MAQESIARDGDAGRPNRTPFEFDGEKYRRASAHQQEWGSRLIWELRLRGDEHILDVGCGDGTLTAQLAECVPRGRVLGVDSSSGMLSAARQLERDNLSFQLMDIAKAEFENEFDLVFSNATLHWITDHVSLLQVLHSALRDGGILRVNFAADGNCQTWFHIARELMRTAFQDEFAGFEWPYYMPTLDEYTRLLEDSPFSSAEVWGENADRFFPNEEAILGWLAQPSIVPFKQYLDAGAAERFHTEVAARLIAATKQDDGTCFETFRRINVLARK